MMRGMQAGVTSLDMPTPQAGPLTAAAGAWVAGLLIGHGWGGVGLWLAVFAAASAAAMLAARRRRTTVLTAAILLALVATAAAWLTVRTQHLRLDDISQWVPAQGSQLAVVTGVVEGSAYMSSPDRGAMGRFAFANPTTIVILDVRTIVVEGQTRSATGKLLVAISEAEHRLRGGDRIRCMGWLAAIDGPSNPGEFDYAAMAQRQGIAGRLTLPRRGNWTMLQPAVLLDAGVVHRLRERIAAACASSLSLGMAGRVGDDRMALLLALLLGQRQSLPRELTEAFREVGLSHILSISGAHLGILIGLVWAVARLLLATPSRSALVALAALLLYLAAVPLHTPIVRAAIMAGLYALAYSTGWRVRRLDPLAAAALVVLIWRPGDLFDAGFQLSYGVVLAMVLFTPAVQAWVTPPFVGEADPFTPGVIVAKWVLGYVAVSLVAFAAAMPIVAYHFQVISPWAVVLSVLALPVVSAVLAMGFGKIVAGLVMPSAGLLLAGPLAWLADTMAGLVEQARTWPGATFRLTQPPAAAWVATTAAVIVAVMAGRFRQRRMALAAAAITCAAWLLWPTIHPPASHTLAAVGRPALVLNMFAVGDGSCFLIRMPDTGHTLMFDCGSQAYLDVGVKSIVPALRRLGVRRIDTLMLSHADMDHLCGVLDVARAVPVARVLAPPQMLREASALPDGPTRFLLDGLRGLGVDVQAVHAGWRERHGEVALQLHWPPADYVGPRRNDESLVLMITVAGRRVLFTGDAAADASTRLINSGLDLTADVTELPHHGSYLPDISPRWLAAVSPRIVLQSSGPARLRHDRWTPHLVDAGITRLVTAEAGMVELVITTDGRIAWSSLKGGAGVLNESPARRSPETDRR
jgi:competence protein ComEC